MTGNEVFSISSSPITTLIFRFSKYGVYDSNWRVSIPNSYGDKLYLESVGNIYIKSLKETASSVNIMINGTIVSGQNVPATTSTYTTFIVKFNSNHTYAWRAYVENGVSDDNVRISAAISSNFVYLSSKKSTSQASINGSVSDVFPSTFADTAFIAKFNSSDGLYSGWRTHVTTSLNDSNLDSASFDVQITPNEEVAFIGNMGTFYGSGHVFKIYVNDIERGSTTTITQSCGFLIKYTSGGNYAWTVRTAPTPGAQGNYSSFNGFVIDSSNNFIVLGQKQPYVYSVYDKNGNSGGTIPAGIVDNCFMIKVNYDGTYSNNYGLFDTTDIDNGSMLNIDNYGNIVFGVYTRSNDTNTLYIYDKKGYATSIRSNQQPNSPFSVLLKFNANFTMNKISL
jgi:hypothetical protein